MLKRSFINIEELKEQIVKTIEALLLDKRHQVRYIIAVESADRPNNPYLHRRWLDPIDCLTWYWDGSHWLSSYESRNDDRHPHLHCLLDSDRRGTVEDFCGSRKTSNPNSNGQSSG